MPLKGIKNIKDIHKWNSLHVPRFYIFSADVVVDTIRHHVQFILGRLHLSLICSFIFDPELYDVFYSIDFVDISLYTSAIC